MSLLLVARRSSCSGCRVAQLCGMSMDRRFGTRTRVVQTRRWLVCPPSRFQRYTQMSGRGSRSQVSMIEFERCFGFSSSSSSSPLGSKVEHVHDDVTLSEKVSSGQNAMHPHQRDHAKQEENALRSSSPLFPRQPDENDHERKQKLMAHVTNRLSRAMEDASQHLQPTLRHPWRYPTTTRGADTTSTDVETFVPESWNDSSKNENRGTSFATNTLSSAATINAKAHLEKHGHDQRNSHDEVMSALDELFPATEEDTLNAPLSVGHEQKEGSLMDLLHGLEQQHHNKHDYNHKRTDDEVNTENGWKHATDPTKGTLSSLFDDNLEENESEASTSETNYNDGHKSISSTSTSRGSKSLLDILREDEDDDENVAENQHSQLELKSKLEPPSSLDLHQPQMQQVPRKHAGRTSSLVALLDEASSDDPLFQPPPSSSVSSSLMDIWDRHESAQEEAPPPTPDESFISTSSPQSPPLSTNPNAIIPQLLNQAAALDQRFPQWHAHSMQQHRKIADTIVNQEIVSNIAEKEEAQSQTVKTTQNLSHDEDYDVLGELLDGASRHAWRFSTDEFNLLLHHLLLISSKSSSTSDAVERAVRMVYNLMVELSEVHENCHPNAYTYATLLQHFVMQEDGEDAALMLCADVLEATEIDEETVAVGEWQKGDTKRQAVVLTPELLRFAVPCLASRDRLEDALTLLERGLREAEEFHRENERSVVDGRTAQSVLASCRRKNRPDLARRVLKLILENRQYLREADVQRACFEVAHWPLPRNQGVRNVAVHCRDVFQLLKHPGHHHRQESRFVARPHVWRRLLKTTHRVARQQATSWPLVADIVREVIHLQYRLPMERQGYTHVLQGHGYSGTLSGLRLPSPEQGLLRIGWEAADSLTDASLAVDLLRWGCLFQKSQFDNQEGSYRFISNDVALEDDWIPSTNADVASLSNLGPPRRKQRPVSRKDDIYVSPMDYSRILRLCMSQNDMKLARCVVLDLCQNVSLNGRVPEVARTQLYTTLVAAYSAREDVEEAMEVLQTMERHGPPPSEKTYGAVLHSLASTGKHEQATELFDSMSTSTNGLSLDAVRSVRPGPTCYGAIMLSAMLQKDWSRVLNIRQQMILETHSLDDLSFHAVLLASLRLKDRVSGMAVLQEAAMRRHGDELSMDWSKMQLFLELFFPRVAAEFTVQKKKKCINREESNGYLADAIDYALHCHYDMENIGPQLKQTLSRFKTELLIVERKDKNVAFVEKNQGAIESRQQKQKELNESWLNALKSFVELARAEPPERDEKIKQSSLAFASSSDVVR